MKPSMVSFLITLLLAAAVSTNGQEIVKDAAGNPVEVDEQYFIQPVKSNGGGLVPSAIQLLPFCPLGINQASLPTQPGLPVIFGYKNLTPLKPVMTTYPVLIEFVSKIWLCNDLSKLWVVDSSSAAKEPAILIGGERLNQNSSFIIEEAESNIYKFTTSTGTVGTIPGIWGGAPQLVLTNDTAKTLLVRFKKVDVATSVNSQVDVATSVTSQVEKLGRLRMFPFY